MAPDAGERFIQPRMVDAQGREALLDDLSGSGFRLLSLDGALLDSLGSDQHAVLDRLDAQVLKVAASGEDGALVDVAGDMAAWLTAKGATAVLLRPDFYVYGTASSAEGLTALVDRLPLDLHATI